ncbi:hypothetical protein B9Z55_027963 [Caenorhabditis nigoni]|uniref:Uncharacterized protein n=1 Tax=Caenorhabditis nigoni TaxID=1611254 RepID=A0A2G5SDS9_9PELO|nr:hypothetical protein B9Z55_027963 [Caenorhabditis nigoni]
MAEKYHFYDGSTWITDSHVSHLVLHYGVTAIIAVEHKIIVSTFVLKCIIIINEVTFRLPFTGLIIKSSINMKATGVNSINNTCALLQAVLQTVFRESRKK